MAFSSLEVIESIAEKYLLVHDLNALTLAAGRGRGKEYSTGLFEIPFSLVGRLTH